ncbi:hypothetical protein Areg01_00560 [Actinoplanes regularis]|nr:hypothetical protein [Actinoplanes regularis]GLW27115.1 hypothetical protein Areg01_00560 [Actinoplanes regularis]
MIASSFPLILVAVVCLVIGLVRGSSSLLIASIVASLLAAVVLVIGWRQSAAARHPEPQDPPDPLDETPSSGPAPRRTSAAPSDAHDSFPADAPFAGDSGYLGESDSAGSPGPAEFSAATGRTGQDDFSGAYADRAYDERPTVDQSVPADPSRSPGAPAAGTHLTDESVESPGSTADHQAASSAIGEARGSEADDQSWRRPTTAAAEADDQSWLRPVAAEPAAAAGSGQSLPGHGSPVADAGDSSLGDGFGEPDADDPDDEPLPQAVRPADAVRVARLDIEVLVVDGRPRYHVADCPHLVGRITEPLPAAEAVELGFSPCGLCRPVDRLLGADARR